MLDLLTAVIIDAGWLGLHAENLSLLITTCADWSVTRYGREKGKSCIIISRDHERSVCWSFMFITGTSGREKTSGLGGVEVSEW